MNLQEDDEEGESQILSNPASRQTGTWLESTLTQNVDPATQKNQSAIAGNKINYLSSISLTQVQLIILTTKGMMNYILRP